MKLCAAFSSLITFCFKLRSPARAALDLELDSAAAIQQTEEKASLVDRRPDRRQAVVHKGGRLVGLCEIAGDALRLVATEYNTA